MPISPNCQSDGVDSGGKGKAGKDMQILAMESQEGCHRDGKDKGMWTGSGTLCSTKRFREWGMAEGE